MCCEIFPVVGSGRFITAPVVTEDGQPIQEPLVALETNQDKASASPSEDGNSAEVAGSSDADNIVATSEIVKELTSHGPLDKKIIQWLLTLHQIGW